MNRIPPHDAEAEKSVLGSMLYDKGALHYGLSALTYDDFFNTAYSVVFKTMADMNAKSIDIDVVTLHNELVNKGVSEQAGALPLLANIMASAYTGANIKYYASIVAEKSMRRKCIKYATSLALKAYDGDYPELLANLEDKVSAPTSTGMKSLPVIVEEVLEDIVRHIKSGKKFTGLTTGFLDFDIKLGGLQDTDLIIIAARPSMGKTAFSLNILQHVSKQFAKQNKASVFFSLEMSEKKIALRTLSSEINIKAEKFRFGTLDETDMRRLQDSAAEYEANMGATYVCGEMNVTTQDIFSYCYGVRGQTGKDIGLIVIDYLQLIKPIKVSGTRNDEISHISRELKRLAKEFDCPVITLSQLSRGAEIRQNHRPILADLRDSGAIEQDADVVAFLYRDEYYNPDTEKKNVAEVIIAKHRDGSLGTVELMFNAELVSFRNICRKHK